MLYPPITLPTLEALYRLGTEICEEIEKFHPDVVLGLAHSGWMPVVVAQALWAGAYPIPSNIRATAELFKHLLSTGINSIINLTNPKDFHRKLSYRKALRQAGDGTGRKVKVKFFPLPFRISLTRQQDEQVLEYISRSLKAGQCIYIHAGHNLEGRTPLSLACLLIQRGLSSEQALTSVSAFWSKTMHFLIRIPLSEL